MNIIDKIAEPEMRRWLCEIFSDEEEQEQIMSFNFHELKFYTNHYYAGGYSAFTQDMVDLKLCEGV